MKSNEEIANDFQQGYDCAMQVAAELMPEIGRSKEEGLKMAACLGVGAGKGSMCGAVTGALIAIGLKYGNTERGDMVTKGMCMAKREEFYRRFTEEFGSLTCPGLLNMDISIPENMAKARELGVLHNFCPKLCSFAIKTAKDLL